MAIVHGKDGRVLVTATPTNIGSTVSWSLDLAGDVADKSAQGDSWKSHLGGMPGWSGTIEALFDDEDTTGQGALTALASVELHFYPEGAGSGNPDWDGQATITGINYSVPLGDAVKVSFNFEGDGILDQSGTQA
jgi:predicted secreted protein